MSLAAQAKVLRVLQEKKLSRVGSDKDINVDVRVLAATNKNLKDEIEKGNFREDLYHRLSVIVIKMPKLDERKSDIPILVEYFIEQICAETGMQKRKVDHDAAVLAIGQVTHLANGDTDSAVYHAHQLTQGCQRILHTLRIGCAKDHARGLHAQGVFPALHIGIYTQHDRRTASLGKSDTDKSLRISRKRLCRACKHGIADLHDRHDGKHFLSAGNIFGIRDQGKCYVFHNVSFLSARELLYESIVSQSVENCNKKRKF
jgi:hypothetical protein